MVFLCSQRVITPTPVIKWNISSPTTEVPEQRRVVTFVCSRWGIWSEQCLQVDECSYVDGLEGQHHHLESGADHDRRPVEVPEGGGSHGRICVDWKQGALQCTGYTAMVLSQRLEVQSSPVQCLDQKLCCIIGEERPDCVDVVGANLQDWVQIGMLGVQDNPSLRSRFLTVGEAILWCPWQWLTDPCKGSLSLGWIGVQIYEGWAWGDVQLSKQRYAKSGTIGYHLQNSGKRIHVIWLQSRVSYCIVNTEVVLILSIDGHQFPERRLWTRSHSLWSERCNLSGVKWTRLVHTQ